MKEKLEPVGTVNVGDANIHVRVLGEPGFETDDVIGRYTGYFKGRLGGPFSTPQHTLEDTYMRGVITWRNYNEYALYILDSAAILGDFAKDDLPRLGETGALMGGMNIYSADEVSWVSSSASTMLRIFGFDKPSDPEEAEKVISLVKQAYKHTLEHYNLL